MLVTYRLDILFTVLECENGYLYKTYHCLGAGE